MNTTQRGITTLLRSGITGENLPMPEGFELKEAYELLCRHSVAPLAYQGALNCGFAQTEETVQKLFRAYYVALIRSEKQLRALEKLFAAFEEKGIPFMPVKGCNTKKLYPQPELRSMGDADILIHEENHERIRPVMEENGFRFLGKKGHVFEWRSDALLIELHTTLVSEQLEDLYAYYGIGWQLARSGGGMRHDLSREDAYLFAFTHFARHYRGGGIGCRHVVDWFVYHRAYPDLDMEYIEEELGKLNLSRFHANTMRMVRVWFEGCKSDEITELMTEYIFSSGNWGTISSNIMLNEAKIAGQMGKEKHFRAHVLQRTLFPPRKDMAINYPWVKKSPLLLPVSWAVRAVEIVCTRPQNISKRLDGVGTVEDKEVRFYQEIMQKVGLDLSENHDADGTK